MSRASVRASVWLLQSLCAIVRLRRTAPLALFGVSFAVACLCLPRAAQCANGTADYFGAGLTEGTYDTAGNYWTLTAGGAGTGPFNNGGANTYQITFGNTAAPTSSPVPTRSPSMKLPSRTSAESS